MADAAVGEDDPRTGGEGGSQLGPDGGQGCYESMTGGPFTPPPCRRCGTTEDFFASDCSDRAVPIERTTARPDT